MSECDRHGSFWPDGLDESEEMERAIQEQEEMEQVIEQEMMEAYLEDKRDEMYERDDLYDALR
ncbi:hypothetical protein JVT61DRAFT_2886 [Boletus reticuloceps]|uniref:Uncharacterized protein n=1 Tax=Boletus reticuloceps TaxID=495285 RepID=A0A8I2YQJ1_9AGAM|nr:hypothetical protein JVT61DRAFT_2886 [Boletus reticuloceps]